MSQNNYNGYLPPDISKLVVDFDKGVKIGSPSRITEINNIFCWMPGFLNCFTGFAGQGKTTFILFMMLVKSVVDGWRWGIWSPEMIDSVKTEKGLERSAHKIYNGLIHAYTGKNPYKHKEKQMEMIEYMKAMDWIKDHFFVLDTWKDKTPSRVINGFKELNGTFGINGWLVDPFKNLTIEEGRNTKDRVLEQVFDEFEELALETDTVGNFIAHPRNFSDETKMRKKGKLDGPYKVVTQHDLLGGSAWDNSMDGIFSWNRQEKHIDPNSPLGSFYTLKQRSQELTTELGYFDGIKFDKNTNRFYFNNICPLDGSVYSKSPFTQSTMFNEPKHEPIISSDNVPF